MDMKYLALLLILFGCSQNHKPTEVVKSLAPPPPPQNIRPPSPPPNFVPNINDVAEIQINPIPHPFNLDGNIPYVVWVNGKRLPLKSHEVRALAQSLNLKFEQPKITAKINSGNGWLFPMNLNNGSKNFNNRKYEQEKAFTK